jgi:hypothetical protein
MTAPKLHLYPIQATHMYEAYPKLSDYLSHSSNNEDAYPDGLHKALRGEAESTSLTLTSSSLSNSDKSSSPNVIPMFRR